MDVVQLDSAAFVAVEHWPAEGPRLHFAHATGMSAAAYAPLLSNLSSAGVHVSAWDAPCHGGSSPMSFRAWNDFVQPLQAVIEKLSPPIIGCGHSFGATLTLMLAHRRPDLFSRLILMEPVIVPKHLAWLWRPLEKTGLAGFYGPARAAAKRTTTFDSIDDAFARYRRASLFSRVSDDHLMALIRGLTRPAPGGRVGLRCNPRHEAALFRMVPHHVWALLPDIPVPVVLIEGARTSRVMRAAVREARRRSEDAVVTQADGTHLFPFETPIETAALIRTFVSDRAEILGQERSPRHP